MWRVGFKGLVRRVDDDLKMMGKWVENELPEHFDELVGLMREQVEAINKKASVMAQNPKDYLPSSWNNVVDSIEQIVEILPELKPENWVDGERKVD